MKLWMVTGLHNPRWAINVRENFERQQFANRALIVVKNGAGRDASIDADIILQSEQGPAQPFNEALAWLRINASSNDWFCKCDADDYYGPYYLDSIELAADSGVDYAGRASLYIKTTKGRLWFAEAKQGTHVFHGPTLAGRIGSSCDFPVTHDWGEDAAWCELMYAAGRSCYRLLPEHFCYQRWDDYAHTWPCTDFEIRTSWMTQFNDLGSLDLSIVNGEQIRPTGTLLEMPPITIDNLMAVRVLKERLQKQGD